MAGIENLLGGFAKGIALGRQQRLDRERQEKNDALTQAYTKMMTEVQKTKLAQTKLAQQALGLLPMPGAGKSVGGTLMPDDTVVKPTSTGGGSAATGQPSLTDMMSNPLTAIMMQLATGLDYPEAVKMGMTQRKNQFDQNEKLMRLLLRLQDTLPGVDVTGPEGQTSRVYPYKYPGMQTLPGQGQGQGLGPNAAQFKFQIPTGPKTMDKPIPPADLPLYIHSETLDSAPPGLSPTMADELGYVRVTAADKGRINDFKSTKVLANQVYNLMGKVFPDKETFLQRMTGAAARNWGAWTQKDNDAAVLKSMLDGTMAAFVRMFEKGTLTDQDIARAKKLNVSLWDDADVAWDKINNLINFIGEISRSFVSGTRRPGRTFKQIPKKEREALLSGDEKELENILFPEG